MWYEFSVAVPAGTTKATPVEVDMKLASGIIHHVVIEGAPGMQRMVSLVVTDGLHQIWPVNPEEVIQLDGVPRDFTERHELTDSPYTLKAAAWAPNTIYSHTYKIGIGVLPRSSFPEYQEMPSKLAQFFRLIGVR